MKKALITGITGQDGSYLAELLLSKGYEVYGVVRRASTFNTGRIDGIFKPEDREFLRFGDLADGIDDLLYSIQPDEVYNLASMSHVRVSFDIPVYTADITAIGLLRILEGLRKLDMKKTRFYQASSSEMFGTTPAPQNENSPFNPVSPYGCFPKGTKIIVFDGDKKVSKSIEDIKVGDIILSYNEKNGKKEQDKVVNTMTRKSEEIYSLEFSNSNIIKCTREHPIYVINKGWIKAEDLKEGDSVLQYKYQGLSARLCGLKRNGKTYKEIYGKDRGAIICEKQKKTAKTAADKRQTGKTYKEIYGKDRGESIGKKISNSNMGKKRSYRWKLTEFTKTKMKGRKPWNTGLTAKTDERLKAVGEKIKKNSKSGNIDVKNKIRESVKKLWTNVDYIKKQISSRTQCPNNHEKIIISILNEVCPNEFGYNGDCRLGILLGRRIPDFVNINGKKKLIEYFGEYWHNMQGRISANKLMRHYSKFGWDCLVIKERELKDIIRLKKRIQNYLYNPNTEIVTVTNISKKIKHCDVYNFETENNHNYFAYGILVHNCSKLFGYHMVRAYRTGYGMFASNGILFNHESPRRGQTFVTRKITQAACRIKLGKQKRLTLGNLNAMRDWGHSKDYVNAIHMILQHNIPEDFVVATGHYYTIKDFLNAVFIYLDMDWQEYVDYDKSLTRPNEVPALQGDSTKIRKVLKWEPKYDFNGLVKEMVDSDMEIARREL